MISPAYARCALQLTQDASYMALKLLARSPEDGIELASQLPELDAFLDGPPTEREILNFYCAVQKQIIAFHEERK